MFKFPTNFYNKIVDHYINLDGRIVQTGMSCDLSPTFMNIGYWRRRSSHLGKPRYYDNLAKALKDAGLCLDPYTHIEIELEPRYTSYVFKIPPKANIYIECIKLITARSDREYDSLSAYLHCEFFPEPIAIEFYTQELRSGHLPLDRFSKTAYFKGNFPKRNANNFKNYCRNLKSFNRVDRNNYRLLLSHNLYVKERRSKKTCVLLPHISQDFYLWYTRFNNITLPYKFPFEVRNIYVEGHMVAFSNKNDTKFFVVKGS